MSNTGNVFTASIGKKMVMGITGLFLIMFLVVHCLLNSLIFLNDGGLAFNVGAHFMATNVLIRTMEVVLILGILIHIFQALRLTLENRKARPVRYAVTNGQANSKWYSRSMGLLGTLLLIFLIVHMSDFWVTSRFIGIRGVDANGNEDLYAEMLVTFSDPWIVSFYVFSMISLAYHLIHGFASAFQTLGWNHKRYTPLVKGVGFWFSIIIAVIFSLMPLAIYFKVI